MLNVLYTDRTIRLARRGRLLPWLGPAFRGLTGGRLKAQVCGHTVADQLARWVHCRGCPIMAGCQYGETFEPDPPATLHLAMGKEDTARPIVFAPQFPVPEHGEAGQEFGLRIVFVGPKAASHAADVWEMVRVGGAYLGLGLGGDHVPFDVLGDPSADSADAIRLPLEPDGNAAVPELTVRLNSPLCLMTSDGNRKTLNAQPTFGDLLRAALRALGPLHRLYGEPLPEDLFRRVKAAGESVPTVRAAFTGYTQPKWSHRTKEHFAVRGIVGHATYGPVPAWLVPWLAHAGWVHVGTHRVTGAGGWHVS